MSVNLTDWIEVFRAGKYPQGSFTEDDVAEMANNYDPNIHEAPITLDHNDKGPAYGWVEQLKVRGGVLLAKFKQVSDSLKKLVSSGQYKKRSAEIYPTFDATGGKYLRAVSFVTVPQVKGLQPAFGDTLKFSDTKGEYQTLSFSDDETPKEHKPDMSKEGGDMDEKQVQALIDNATASFSEKIDALESQHKAETEKYEGEITKLKEQNTNALTKLSEAEQAQKAAEINTFCDKMKSELRLTPAMETSAMPIMKVLAGVSETVKFSEGDKEVEKTPLALFQDFIKSLPKIDNGEFAAGDYGQRNTGNNYATFADKAGSPVDEQSAKIATRADAIVVERKWDEKDPMKYAEALKIAETELGVN
jgi:hypothetical protein